MTKLAQQLAVAVALFGAAAGAVEVDAVAARVNSEVILKSEVMGELRRTGAGEDQYAQLLDAMIERRLVLKAAADAKMTLQDWVVDNRVREILAKGFGGNRTALLELLGRQRISYADWRKRIKEDLIISAMGYQTVTRNIAASPALLRREYAEHPERYVADRRVTVSVILLKPDEFDRRTAVSEALKTNDFAAVAREYSSDRQAAEGGVWRDVNPGEVFRPEVAKEIARMPMATISDWIDLDGYSFLLRKDAETSSRQLSFEEAYDALDAEVRRQEGDRLHREWIARLRAAAFVKVY